MGDIKYIAQFESLSGIKYQISIYDDDYTGASDTFKLNDDGFQLTYEGDTSNPWQAVIPSRLEFTFNVETQDDEDFVIACATAQPNRFKIFVTHSTPAGNYTDALYWQGYLQGEGIEIYDQYFPYEVTLAASDLSYMAEVNYNDGSPTTTGVDTGVKHILNALDYAGQGAFASAHGFDPVLQTVVDWRGVSMEAGGDPLDKTGIDYHTFFGYDKQNAANFRTCREVIESISRLFGARFFQSNGLFRLQQYDALIETTNDYQDYNLDKTSAGGGTTTWEYDLDRVNKYRMRGGSTSFFPGLLSAQREYEYRRNYLEGQSADQSTPLDFNIGDIPLLTYYVAAEVPKFAIRFDIVYQIIEPPFRDPALIGHPTATWRDNWSAVYDYGIFYKFVPYFRMYLTGVGATDGKTYVFSQASSMRPTWGLESSSRAEYLKTVKSRKRLVEYHKVLPIWRDVAVTDPDVGVYEIFDEAEYIIDQSPLTGTDAPHEQVLKVEIVTPTFGDPLVAQAIEDLSIQVDIHKLYSSAEREWSDQAGITDLDNYVTWRIENIEFIVHGNDFETRPETKRKYKVESPDDYRKAISLDDCDLVAWDKKSWHSIQTWNGSSWGDDKLWYRGSDSLNFQLMGYLSVREQVAMNRRGLRLYQGGIVSKGGVSPPHFYNIITDGDLRYIMLTGTFQAKQDEWTSVSLLELTRNEDDLVYTEVKVEGSTSSYESSSLPSGNGSGPAGGSGGVYEAPEYEYATGVTSSAYTITGFSLDTVSAYSTTELNKVLWVFQDSTKLIAGLGYTLSGETLTFTDDLEDAELEIYYYG